MRGVTVRVARRETRNIPFFGNRSAMSPNPAHCKAKTPFFGATIALLRPPRFYRGVRPSASADPIHVWNAHWKCTTRVGLLAAPGDHNSQQARRASPVITCNLPICGSREIAIVRQKRRHTDNRTRRCFKFMFSCSFVCTRSHPGTEILTRRRNAGKRNPKTSFA